MHVTVFALQIFCKNRHFWGSVNSGWWVVVTFAGHWTTPVTPSFSKLCCLSQVRVKTLVIFSSVGEMFCGLSSCLFGVVPAPPDASRSQLFYAVPSSTAKKMWQSHHGCRDVQRFGKFIELLSCGFCKDEQAVAGGQTVLPARLTLSWHQCLPKPVQRGLIKSNWVLTLQGDTDNSAK